MQQIRVLMLVGLVALLLGGCAGLTPGGASMIDMDHAAMATQTPRDGTDSTSSITGTQAMTDTGAMTNGQMSGMDHSAMTMDPAKPFDAQFIDSMNEHHQGAIDMATQALAGATQPELRALAEEVIAAQTKEIEEMMAWREAWYADLPPTGGLGMGMGEMALSTDESTPFDQRFLEAMISHHQGAIDMAKIAQQMAEHAEIKTLAEAIITAQEAEIELMQSWLKEWFGVGAAPSPYLAELDSPVRGLSAREVDDLIAGRGMGFARMAN